MTEALIALLFGLLIGSFLNVTIHRWPRGRSVVRPRSHCVRCRKMIPWYDNIPLLSYLLLGGRCRYCRQLISVRYPAVELCTGLLFFYFVRKLGLTPVAAKYCILAAMLLALAVTDLEKRLLPDEFTLGGLGIGIALAWFVPSPDPDTLSGVIFYLAGIQASPRVQSLAEAVLAAAVLSGILWGAGRIYLAVRGREGLGFGDVKLVAMIGSFLGFRLALASMAWGGVVGSVLGLIYIWITHKDASTFELPYGTFLSAAALVTAMLAV
ncbi:MAG TPA: prepilin peptidase [Bryobacteraceae bacterium]|nr:prepilin peptidase [Bryobacteraceae bacterium]